MAAEPGEYHLNVVWFQSVDNQANLRGPSQLSERIIKTWTLSDVMKHRKAGSREKDPGTGDVRLWEGVLLSDVLNDALSELSPDMRAQIDLVILRNAQGQAAQIPRAFIVKYPVLLASSRDRHPLDSRMGPLHSVAPWTSRAKAAQEELPLATFFLAGVSRIELTNYRDRYGPLYLKRRTDPIAMRGEKLFVQNCVNCHTNGGSTPLGSYDRLLKGKGIGGQLVGVSYPHPSVKGFPAFNQRNQKSLLNYITAYRIENPTIQAEAPHPKVQ